MDELRNKEKRQSILLFRDCNRRTLEIDIKQAFEMLKILRFCQGIFKHFKIVDFKIIFVFREFGRDTDCKYIFFNPIYTNEI